ncbi:sugar ABC transporter substrate-binding protein [Roseateles asaccharophilus]|uniref:Chitobiose transport system substrate-binding protein n=1 Tax=Roseateles asaccharophilus TaxID=582607 RepID=A0ABU2ABF6_9BURK|nr:sugar ABC transporter substrate-binding protein [Roseateles asaccharophilus]MDR7334526.1 putative chitobiose transport system substrate-binding protein [Roseateles asaccharophilus]
MKRHLLALTAASVLLATSAASARSLEFWTMQLSPQLDGYMNALIQRYEAAHPGVKVKWVDLPWAEMERKVLTAIAAGQAPDVVNLNPQFAAKLAEFGALAEPEQHLSAAQVASYLPAAWAGNCMDGKTFALPWYVTVNLTLYRRGLLQDAGISAPPRSHAELLTVAPKLATHGRHAYFPALDGSHPLETLVAMGTPLLDARGCAGFANDQGAAAFGFYRDLYQRKWVPRNVVTEGHRKAVELFVAGEVAMISTGMQFLNFIKTSNADLYTDIDIAPPLARPGTPPNLAVMNLAVPAASKQKQAAFDFAAFVSNADNQLAFAKAVPVLPSSRASYGDAFLSTTPASGDLTDRARALSAQLAQQGQVLVPPMRAYSKLRNSYAIQLQAQMLGKQAPAAALQTVTTQWNRLLGCKP